MANFGYRVFTGIATVVLASVVVLSFHLGHVLFGSNDHAEQYITETAQHVAESLDSATPESITEAVGQNDAEVVRVHSRPAETDVVVSVVAAAGIGGKIELKHCYEYRVPNPDTGKVSYKRVSDDRCVKPTPRTPTPATTRHK